MSGLILGFFKYSFLTRAFLAGFLISISVAVLGVSLVLKKYSMIGDGLSHVGFSSFSIACAMNWAPFLVSIPVTVFFAVLLLLVRKSKRVKSDGLIALISNSCLAVSIVVVYLKKGINKEVLSYMFGSILALENLDLVLTVILCLIVILSFIFLYNKIFAITFDEDFAKAVGVNVNLYNLIIAVLTALTIVVGIKMVGALLISSLIVFPVISVSMLFKSYKKIVLFSALESSFCFVLGFILSYVFSVPTGALVVLVNLFFLLICFLISGLKKVKF